MGMQGKLKTVSGPLVTVNDALARNAKSLVVNFAPVQASGTPAPDNVLPISGWTGVTGYRTGKNLLDKSQCVDGWRLSILGDGFQDWQYYISPYIPVKEGSSYTKNSPTADVYHRFCTYSDKDIHAFIRKVDDSNTITIANGESYIRFCGLRTEKDTAQLELGSTSTPYAPYSGTTYPVDWTDTAGTVYGGYVDLVSGVLRVQCMEAVVDENTPIGIFPWGGVQTDSATGTEFARALFKRTLAQPKASIVYGGYCDSLPFSTTARAPMGYASFYDGDTYGPIISLPTSVIGTTNETLAQWLHNHPIRFVYRITISQQPTYQLTPQTIAMLKGTNNVWSNANGNVELTYYAQ